MKSESSTFTYQARISSTGEMEAIFKAYAEHYNHVERTLFAAVAAGRNPGDLKSEFIARFGVTGRQFNACRIQLEGKIASIKELRVSQIAEAKQRIVALEKTIDKLKKRKTNVEKIHQKKRRLIRLRHKLDKQIADQKAGRVPLCFGSKKLFRAQFALEENGYTSHEEWLAAWQGERNSSFFVVGSKDENTGNQSCTAVVESDSLALRLRLPNALSKYGKYLEIPNVKFDYGFEVILAALEACNERKALSRVKDPHYKGCGQAISYRFKKDKKGWLVFVTVTMQMPACITREGIGAIGVDINADHLAVVETDRYGNPIKNKIIPLNCYGKSTNQAKALIGDVVAELVKWGISSQKPIIIEKLDFQKKKNELKESENPKHARMLSSLAYTTIANALKSRAWRFGVRVKEVNPAYTSVIGRTKFADRYGLTIHESAALCIARRFQGASERVPRRLDKVPDGKCGHVALSLPVRNRGKHVWSQWGQIKKELSVVHAAHVRAKRSSSRSRPACCDGENPLGPRW